MLLNNWNRERDSNPHSRAPSVPRRAGVDFAPASYLLDDPGMLRGMFSLRRAVGWLEVVIVLICYQGHVVRMDEVCDTFDLYLQLVSIGKVLP